MTTRGTTIARMRGGFVGSLSGAVAVAAHASGGGAAPSCSAAVLLLLACTAVGALVSAARPPTRELPFLIAALIAGQATGHAALTVGAASHHGTQPTPTMLTAHAVAVAVAAVLIRGGGRGLAVAASRVRGVLPAPFTAVPVEVPGSPTVPAHRPEFERWLLVGARLGTRGPPALV
ncbi:hypothetical protein ACFYVR_13575 [Rhodococcus sp. NPDC003318]|uniref:hypothetical protein n=1 Tax=Rhodococcus sp. NPDC003318 TaxID=3364503 RepID=UPI00367DA8C3